MTPREQVPAKTLRFQDIVSIFSSLSGLIVGMLWIAGRYYMAAYFEAMNIPFSQINYSIWEYVGALIVLISVIIGLAVTSTIHYFRKKT